MKSGITRKHSPEEQELNKKLVELATLEAELAERELELATLQGELHAFEREYLRVVGIRYAELDELEAEIAKYLALSNPKDSDTRKQAEEAWTRAQESRRAVNENVTDSESTTDFKPWESLKKLYREVAKRIHPDLTTDENERLRRQKLMTEANLAYENGDEKRLMAILNVWKNGSDLVQEDGVAAKLIRIIQEIAQVKERLQAIQREIEELKQSELYQLKEKNSTLKPKGRDLLVEMASQIEEQIADAKERLEKLKAKVGF